jgi:hypothetical protein
MIETTYMATGGYLVPSLSEGNVWYLYRDGVYNGEVRLEVLTNCSNKKAIRSDIRLNDEVKRELNELILNSLLIW